MNHQTSINATRGLFALFIPVFAFSAVGYALIGDAFGDKFLIGSAGFVVVVWIIFAFTGRLDADQMGAQ